MAFLAVRIIQQSRGQLHVLTASGYGYTALIRIAVVDLAHLRLCTLFQRRIGSGYQHVVGICLLSRRDPRSHTASCPSHGSAALAIGHLRAHLIEGQRR